MEIEEKNAPEKPQKNKSTRYIISSFEQHYVAKVKFHISLHNLLSA